MLCFVFSIVKIAPIIVTEDIFYEGKIEMLLEETSKFSRRLRRRELEGGGYPPEKPCSKIFFVQQIWRTPPPHPTDRGGGTPLFSIGRS